MPICCKMMKKKPRQSDKCGQGSKTLADHDALQKYLKRWQLARAGRCVFETVMVNDDNADIRQNRLNLLHGLIAKMRRAAAFDLIE